MTGSKWLYLSFLAMGYLLEQNTSQTGEKKSINKSFCSPFPYWLDLKNSITSKQVELPILLDNGHVHLTVERIWLPSNFQAIRML